MTARPVVTRVSQATRPFGSCFITSSRTASEIWSAILSGWPSVTDSDVNRKLRNASLKLILLCDLRGKAPRQTFVFIRHPAKPFKSTIRWEKNQRIESKDFNLALNGRNWGLNGN